MDENEGSNNSGSNTGELDVPTWMDQPFFEKILFKLEDKAVQIEELKITRATKAGDNFASVLYRVSVTLSSKSVSKRTQSLIVKIMPFVEGFKKDIMDGIGYRMFATEIKMYSEIIPAFERKLREFGDNTALGGRCLYTAMEPDLVLIFEDLNDLGYKTANWGGNWDIAWKAIEKLGRWHALSYAVAANGNTELQKFDKNFYIDNIFTDFSLYRDSYKSVLGMLQKHSDLSEYIPKFEKIIAGEPLKNVQKLFKAFSNGDKAGLYVLNHSDVNIKNLMYKDSESGEVEDVKLIDFQLCIWGPAVIDLILVFYMILDHDSRINRRDEIVYHYFRIFTETLDKIQFKGDRPKFTDIYKDLFTYKDFEVVLACGILPMILNMDHDQESEDVVANDDLRKDFYSNPEYVDIMRKLLPFFLHRGYLD